MLKTTTVKTAPRIETHAEAYKMLDRPEAAIIRIKLQPGEKIALHANPFDVAFYIMKGTPNIITDTENMLLSEDTVIEVPKNTPRGVENNSEHEVLILAFKFLINS